MSEQQLRDIYLTPFEASVKAGAASFMTAFNDLNGVPCTANEFLLKDVLRKEWKYDGHGGERLEFHRRNAGAWFC